MGTCDMRGAAFYTYFEALKALRGPATEAAVRAALPDELRRRLADGGLTRVGWYPLAEYASLHAATDAVVKGGADFARLLGRATTEIDTRGLIRFVLAISSPDLLMRHASKVFSSYVRGAEVVSRQIGPRHWDLRWKGLVGATAFVHVELEGGAAYLVERSGGKHVRLESGPAQAGPEHAFTLRWE